MTTVEHKVQHVNITDGVKRTDVTDSGCCTIYKPARSTEDQVWDFLKHAFEHNMWLKSNRKMLIKNSGFTSTKIDYMIRTIRQKYQHKN